MKVSIEGEIVDTKNIYKIGNIVGDECWNVEGWISPEQFLTHSGYEFTIEFFNKKNLIIRRGGNDIFKNDTAWWSHYKKGDVWVRVTKEEYEERLKIIYDELNAFRNIVIGYWNESKAEIPEIKFEK